VHAHDDHLAAVAAAGAFAGAHAHSDVDSHGDAPSHPDSAPFGDALEQERQRQGVPGALSTLHRDNGVRRSPGRTEKGNLRNFASMSDDTLLRTSDRLRESDDQEAKASALRVLHERFDERPQEMEQAAERAGLPKPQRQPPGPDTAMAEAREHEQARRAQQHDEPER
jgi:hypothetical protein